MEKSRRGIDRVHVSCQKTGCFVGALRRSPRSSTGSARGGVAVRKKGALGAEVAAFFHRWGARGGAEGASTVRKNGAIEADVARALSRAGPEGASPVRKKGRSGQRWAAFFHRWGARGRGRGRFAGQEERGDRGRRGPRSSTGSARGGVAVRKKGALGAEVAAFFHRWGARGGGRGRFAGQEERGDRGRRGPRSSTGGARGGVAGEEEGGARGRGGLARGRRIFNADVTGKKSCMILFDTCPIKSVTYPCHQTWSIIW
ncbi:cold shock protein 2-like [Musa acuminata AAA Group]|uniref:cold shock protein 2-like n=1 Tax=Musa acuminata AAA Group TaxID=214697 RepID=UPI0031DBBC44